MNASPKANKNNTQASSKIDYVVMVNAIAGAALSRRAALQMELAVSLVHFTQEKEGTDTTGKANMKAVYHGAGYLCMAKADRDYKTVNRRLNAMAKLFDKVGSSVVHGWIAKASEDTQEILDCVQAELVAFGFDTLDDVLEYVGTDTNRTRAPRQTSGPVLSVVSTEGEAAEQAPAPAAFNADGIFASLVANMNAEELREFCTKLLVHVATVELAAAPAQQAA